MPIYEYRCNKCGTVSEILTGVSREDPSIQCDACGSNNVKKLISASNFTVGASSSKKQEFAPCGAPPGEACDHCRHAG